MNRASKKSATSYRYLGRFQHLEQRTVLNGAPVASDNAYQTTEDTELTGNILSDDTGNGVDTPTTAFVASVDGAPLPIGGHIALSSGATLQIDANGSFSFDASTADNFNQLDDGESTTDGFDYTISHGFSQMFVFGDSLSDAGNLQALTQGAFPPDPPYFGGRSAGGALWPEYLAPQMNIAPENVHNFAIFGAGTGRDNFNDALLGADLPGVLDEVDQFIGQLQQAGAPADPNALYVLWAGPNDFFNPPEDPEAAIAASIGNLVTTVATLQGAGAQHILVPNMPDLGATPFAISLGLGESLTTFSVGFNQALESTFAGLGIDVIDFNSFEFFAGLVPVAESLGLTNITEPCFNQATFEICTTPGEYAYWDSVHPTTRVHELLADAMLAELLANSPLDQTDTATVTIDFEGATTIPTAGVAGPAETVPGHTVTFELSATDASTADQNGDFSYWIDWDDGTTEQITGPASGTTASHTYSALGDFEIDVTATDHDNDTSGVASHEISVQPAALIEGQLLAGGTNARNRIAFRQTTGGQVQVRVDFYRATFDVTPDVQLIAYGLGGNDSIFAGNVTNPVELYGGNGNDYLRGSAQDDLLVGGSGNDLLIGGDGNNHLIGGDGRDRIIGGGDADTIEGGLGNDYILARDGNDTVSGGDGNDYILGGNGDDHLQGGAGNDFIFAGAGQDMILGELGRDQLFGGSGDDEIDGGEGYDLIFGGSGLDEILNGERVFP